MTGPGVGREVYVRSRNIATGTLTLSQPLYGGAGTRNYTFLRYRYAFDFSTVPQIDRFYFMNVDFGLDGIASGVLLPPRGGSGPSATASSPARRIAALPRSGKPARGC